MKNKILILFSFLLLLACNQQGFKTLSNGVGSNNQVGSNNGEKDYLCDTLSGNQIKVVRSNKGLICQEWIDGKWVDRSCDNVGYCPSTSTICDYCCTSNQTDGGGTFFGYSFRINGTDPRYSSYQALLDNDEGYEIEFIEDATFADVGVMKICGSEQISTLTYFNGDTDNAVTLTFGNCEVIYANNVIVKNFPEEITKIKDFCLAGTEPFFDFIDVTEIDQENVSTNIIITPDDSGFLETMEVGLDNVSFNNSTFDIEFFLDGVAYPIIANNNSYGDITKAGPAQSDFLIDVGIPVVGGQSYTLSMVTDAPPGDLTFLITEATDPQVRYSLFVNSPAVSWYSDTPITYCEVLYSDNTRRYFDEQREIERGDITSNAEYVSCNATTTEDPEVDQRFTFCFIINATGEKETGFLVIRPDGTRFVETVDGAIYPLDNTIITWE